MTASAGPHDRLPGPDERPVLVCRLECPPRMQADVDGWMPKHFDDSLLDPHVMAAANYAVLSDFRPLGDGGLPSLLNGHGNRFIVYVADSIDGYETSIDSERVRAAIRDGAEREGQYPPLDDEPFNGVVYAVRGVRGAVGRDLVGSGPILVERFEVPTDEAAAFDAWLDGPHLDAALALPGAVRARTFAAHRDYPRRFPYDRYRGKGNRMLLVEFTEGRDARVTVADARTRAWLQDSLRWDLRLPYVRREVAVHLVTRTKADALAARGDGGAPDGGGEAGPHD
jgi:hypothetical protein